MSAPIKLCALSVQWIAEGSIELRPFQCGFRECWELELPQPLCHNLSVKVVGQRVTTLDLGTLGPLEALRRATELQRQADQVNPYPRPRGFVFKARTREDYARWRREQSNPRLW